MKASEVYLFNKLWWKYSIPENGNFYNIDNFINKVSCGIISYNRKTLKLLSKLMFHNCIT